MRSPAATRTPSNVTSYWVSDAMVRCCVSVTPAAAVDEEQVDVALAVAGAREHEQMRCGGCERHVALLAVEHEAVAVGGRPSWTPAGPKPLPGSSHAGVTIASPRAIFGSQLAASARRCPRATARRRR